MKNKKVAIVGGGITGLVAGYRLAKKGCQVTIFEKSESLGGLLGDFKIEGEPIEKAYHHIFKTDKYIIDLIEELGLTKKLKWHESKTGLYLDGKIWPFNGAIDLLNFRALDFFSKLRLGLVKIYLEKENNWQRFEKVLAYQWMERWCGKRAYRVIWEPLLKGKFANRYKDISMAWLWARIHTRANSSEKGKEYLGYMEGGFGQVTDELARRIRKMNGLILLNSRFTDFDGAIIDTTALPTVDYLGAITVVFSSKQSLSKFYWHNINDSKSPFLAFIQHTNLMGTEKYNGKNIYYLGTYLPQDHHYFKDNDNKIYRDFFTYLKKIFPDFDEKQIREKQIFRFKFAQQLVTTDYRLLITDYDLPKGKLFHANFAQIYPEDRGINFAVREAERVMGKI